MNVIVCTVLIFCSAWCDAEAKLFQGFLIPEDIQSILNIAYSRLPPVKFGNDKRFGVGFRLGRNADFQILLELGPQSETNPLGEPDNNLGKRESPNKYYNWKTMKQTTSEPIDYKTTTKSSHYKPLIHSLNTEDNTVKYSNDQVEQYRYTKNKIPDRFYHKLSVESQRQIQTSTHKSVTYDQVKTSTNQPEIHNKVENSTYKSATHNETDSVVNNEETTSQHRPSIQHKDVNRTNQLVTDSQTTTSRNIPVTHSRVSYSTSKQMESILYKKSESIFGMFVNWLTGLFTYNDT